MPFKSKAQRKYLHAYEPEIAARWEQETPRKVRRKLPEHVAKDDEGVAKMYDAFGVDRRDLVAKYRNSSDRRDTKAHNRMRNVAPNRSELTQAGAGAAMAGAGGYGAYRAGMLAIHGRPQMARVLGGGAMPLLVGGAMIAEGAAERYGNRNLKGKRKQLKYIRAADAE